MTEFAEQNADVRSRSRLEELERALGRTCFHKGDKSKCRRVAESLERTAGITAWTIAQLDTESVWGLFV